MLGVLSSCKTNIFHTFCERQAKATGVKRAREAFVQAGHASRPEEKYVVYISFPNERFQNLRFNRFSHEDVGKGDRHFCTHGSVPWVQ